MEQKFSEIGSKLEELDAKICDMVEKTFDFDALDKIDRKLEKTIETATNRVVEKAHNMTDAFVAKQEQRKMASGGQLFAKTSGARMAGFVMAGIGFVYGVVFAIAILGADDIGEVILMVALVLGLLFLGIKGVQRVQRTRRFEQYVRYFKASGKTYENVAELAAVVYQSPSFVSKELQKIMAAGWFKEGHFVENDQTLIITHETFKMYQQLRSERQALERQTAREESSLPAQAKAVLEKGNGYLVAIQASAKAIKKVEVKEQIAKLEDVIGKIFNYVKEHPECVNGLQKMMNHYLPMTAKIVDSYDRLSIPTSTPQIVEAKAEIEEMLDTLAVAFEKLLSRLFKEVVWDASTDVSVLQNMLAGEGLIKKDFEM